MNTVIVNMALAAGLRAFAPIQTQAGLVIDNSLVSPAKIKLVTYIVNAKNKIVKVGLSNKDILTDLGAPKGSKLAVYDGEVDVISDKEVVLTDVITTSNDIYSENGIEGKGSAYKYVETGLTYLQYEGSEFAFDVSGAYQYKENSSDLDKKGYYQVSNEFSSSTLSGFVTEYGDTDVDSSATGSCSSSGIGKLDSNY